MDRKDIFIVKLYLLVALDLQGKNIHIQWKVPEFRAKQHAAGHLADNVLLTQQSEYGLEPIMFSLKGRICYLKWGWTSL